jgi:hypothetical protein
MFFGVGLVVVGLWIRRGGESVVKVLSAQKPVLSCLWSHGEL